MIGQARQMGISVGSLENMYRIDHIASTDGLAWFRSLLKAPLVASNGGVCLSLVVWLVTDYWRWGWRPWHVIVSG